MRQTFEPSRLLLQKNPGGVSTEMVSRSILKVTMWVTVRWYDTIGPYFFEDDQRCNCTMNQTNYREMIRNVYLPVLHSHARTTNNLIKMKTQWFQRDGAPPQIARELRLFLKQRFDGRFFSLCDTVKWPPYSPDLTPPDFFLWGYLKHKIYGNSAPRILDQLKENIC